MKPFWDLIEKSLGADFAEDRDLVESIRELSLAFTEERDQLPRDYLDIPELQAAYLAYFVPLNFTKIYALLTSHAGTWPAQLDADREQRWCDLGSGPGTATLAALAAYRHRYRKLDRLPPVHIDLVDRQTGALNLADNLVRDFAKAMKIDVTVELHTELPDSALDQIYDLSLAANVLNELPAEQGAGARELLLRLWDGTRGTMLVLEPGHRVSSQRLVRFRERLLKESLAETKLLGPCPHSGRCPVYRSKHWCHFSEPVLDGRLIDLNLRVFKNPRGWLKFSYLLFARGRPIAFEPGRYRAIGDLHQSGPKWLSIDLCQPESKHALRVPANIPPDLRASLVRGATVTVENHKISARPMTKRPEAPLPEITAFQAKRELPRPGAKRQRRR